MVRKRGAKPNYTIHPDTGETLDGLYENKDNRGRIRFYYYLDENGKQKTCTSDIRKAIKRLNAFKEKNKFPDLIEVPEEAKTFPIPGTRGALIDDDYVNKEWIIKKFQEILNDDRKLVVDVTENSNYWDFENTPSRPQSLTCQEVIEEYLFLKRNKPLNYDYRYKVIRHWKVFKNAVNKTFIRDITFQDVKRYRLSIIEQADEKKKSGKIKRVDLFINERFSTIHSILTKIIKFQEYKKDIENLLTNTGQLILFPKEKIRPKVINREQWSILFKHSESNLFIRCGLLLGLNCAMTWGDIIDLTTDKFDFKKKIYIGTRSKNDIQNCAMLFDETIESLQQYIKTNPSKNGKIFYFKDVTRKTLLDDILKELNDWKDTLPTSNFKKVENITQKKLRKSVRTTALKAKCHIEH